MTTVLLEQLTCFHLLKKFSAFYGTRKFFTALTSAFDCFATWYLYGEDLLGLHPTPKLEDNPLSFLRDCLFNTFAPTLHIFRICPDRPWGSPRLLCNGYRVFPGVYRGRSVTLAPHPLLVPWSEKSRVIPLFPLWVVRPVQSLSACTRVHFTFFTIKYNSIPFYMGSRDSAVVIATSYGLDGPGIECRWGSNFLHPSRPALVTTQPPI